MFVEKFAKAVTALVSTCNIAAKIVGTHWLCHKAQQAAVTSAAEVEQLFAELTLLLASDLAAMFVAGMAGTLVIASSLRRSLHPEARECTAGLILLLLSLAAILLPLLSPFPLDICQ